MEIKTTPELIAWAKDQTIEHRDEALAPVEIQPLLRQAQSESFVTKMLTKAAQVAQL